MICYCILLLDMLMYNLIMLSSNKIFMFFGLISHVCNFFVRNVHKKKMCQSGISVMATVYHTNLFGIASNYDLFINKYVIKLVFLRKKHNNCIFSFTVRFFMKHWSYHTCFMTVTHFFVTAYASVNWVINYWYSNFDFWKCWYFNARL